MDPESGLDAVRHVGIRGGTIEAVSADAARGHARHRRVAPRRRARLHRPSRARAAGRVVPDDGARRRHLGVRARGGHRRRGGVVQGARRRADRQLRRVHRPHPGADEGAGRSGQRAPAGRHRRQRHRPPTRRWRRWKRSSAKGSRRARWRWASAARTRRARRCRRSSGCSASPRPAACRRTSTCAAASPGCARRSRRRSRPARRCTSSTSTRRRATSSTGSSPPIKAARDAGQDVTTEAYPYGAGMTEIQSALFDDWATLARRALRAAPARLDRRAPDARDLRARRGRRAAP